LPGTLKYTFPKNDRLTSRKLIENVFSKGKSFSNFPFKVVWLSDNSNTVLQTGVGVSAKYFKKAVDRNRIKRLIRESYRLQKHSLEDTLKKNKARMSVFILFTANEIPPYELVFDKIGKIITRLEAQINENS